MIPTIGVMIGAYIITRMVELIARTDQPESYAFVRILAVITIAVTVLAIISLYSSSAMISDLLP